jgi:glycerophosphoryl diester phosphodiesterase
VLIVAHRGGNPDDVENSAEAFRHGLQVGADLLECDLQLAADGRVVVFHNTRYFGAPVSAFTTDELRGLIPTLLTMDELVTFINGLDPDARLVLDLKDRRVDRALVPYLLDGRFAARVLVTSTFSCGLWRLRRRLPGLRTGLSRGATLTRVSRPWRPLAALVLTPVMILLALLQMRLAGIRTAVLHHELARPGVIRFFKRRGVRVYVWTIDSIPRARALESSGVDYLTTNVPATMVPYFGHKSSRAQEEGGSTP